MKTGLTDITVVLDRSGSMSAVVGDTIGGFNSFLKSQKDLNVGEANITLTQFDTEFEVVYSGKNVKDAPNLTTETFVPRGMTALYDAIGKTINEVGLRIKNTAESERPSNVIMVIITDGYENSSKEFTGSMINDMINHQRDTYKWDFVFLGANQDAIKTAASIGIQVGASLTYSDNSMGTACAYSSIARATSDYRSSGGLSMSSGFFSDEDREAQEDAKNAK